MPDDFLTLLEQHKELLKPETYRQAKENMDKIPDEVKQRIIEKLQSTSKVKELIDEYDDERNVILGEAAQQFTDIEDRMEQKYKEAYKKAEAQEQEEASKQAEESLKQI